MTRPRTIDNLTRCEEAWLVDAMRDVLRDRPTHRRADFDAHLETCTRCRVELERLRRMERVWDDMVRSEQNYADELAASPVAVSRRGRAPWRYALAAAFVACAALVGFTVWRRTPPADRAMALPVAFASPTVEQTYEQPSAHATSIAPIDPWKPATREDVPLPALPETSVSAEPSKRYNAARRSLEPRIRSGEATTDEMKMLRAICRAQGDRDCVERMTRMLAPTRAGVDDDVLEERAEVAANGELNMYVQLCAAVGDHKCVEMLGPFLWDAGSPRMPNEDGWIPDLRRHLETSVKQGTGTSPQLFLLRSLCRRQHDSECVARVTARIRAERASK